MRRWARWLPLLLIAVLLAVAVAVRHADHGGDGPYAHGAAAEAGGHDAAHAGHDVPAAADGPPLLEIMRDLERDLVAVTAALWRDDLAALAVAARRVADHPRVGADERSRIQARLGADFGRFAAADHVVHEAALRLVAAAEGGEREALLGAKANLERGCAACHEQFRERLVGR